MSTPVKNANNLMASATDTGVQVLTTVATLAGSVTRTVGALGTGLDMLEAFVDQARENQIARQELDSEIFFERLNLEAAKERAELRAEHQRMLNNSGELQAHYTDAYKSVSEVTKRLKAERDARRQVRMGIPAPVVVATTVVTPPRGKAA